MLRACSGPSCGAHLYELPGPEGSASVRAQRGLARSEGDILSKSTRSSGRKALALASLTTVALSLALIAGTSAGAAPSARPHGSSHIGGVVRVKGSAAPAFGSNLDYHGGPVMKKKNVAYAIYWQPPTLQNGNPSHVSATYHSLIERFFGDFGGTGLNKVATQYYQIKKGKTQYIKANASLGGTWTDTSAFPASGCNDSATPGNCLTDNQIQAEVKKAMNANGWKGGMQHQFFVFTSYGEGSCFASGPQDCAFTAYCAYHGEFKAAGLGKVIYANQPYAGTNLNACSNGGKSPNNDWDADATINVMSHEQREATNDPLLNAWWNSSNGYEGSDQCAWQFGTIKADGSNVTFNGHLYLVQQEWSNNGSHCVLTYP